MTKGHESEWVGGVFSLPVMVTGDGVEFEGRCATWMELPSTCVVGHAVVLPGDPLPTAIETLQNALRNPLTGSPRTPPRIRVADAGLAAAVTEALGPKVHVTVAPTPELQQIQDLFANRMMERRREPSYFSGGAIDEATFASFFAAAKQLYGAAPWQAAGDHEVLHMDIEALGVSGACVSIMGNAGYTFGVNVFPSLDGYLTYVNEGTEALATGRTPTTFGTAWLALSFSNFSDLSPTMQHEITTHGWLAAATDVYPTVLKGHPGLGIAPVTADDYRILDACARAVATFLECHHASFGIHDPTPVFESLSGPDGIEVRLTFPYEAFRLFGQASSVRSTDSDADQVHDRDSDWSALLLRYAVRRFGTKIELAKSDFDAPQDTMLLLMRWGPYGFPIKGHSVVDRFLRDNTQSVGDYDRAFLEAQRAAWLSLWEVVSVVPGEQLTLRDLLSGEVREVVEKIASTILVSRDVVLARVLDFEGISVFSGIHPRYMPPRFSVHALQQAQARLKSKTPVPLDRLRDGKLGRYLIRSWEMAVRQMEEAQARPTTFCNRDGHPLLITIDHYEVVSGSADDIAEKLLLGFPDIEAVPPPAEDDDCRSFVLFRQPVSERYPEDNLVYAQISVQAREFRVETNSVERADEMRSILKQVLRSAIRYRSREHVDIHSAAAQRNDHEPAEYTPQMLEVMSQFKRDHYARWVDQPLPVLGGKTPREASRTAKGRADLELLLREMENMEHRNFGSAAFDIAPLRAALGMPAS